MEVERKNPSDLMGDGRVEQHQGWTQRFNGKKALATLGSSLQVIDRRQVTDSW